MEEKQKRIYWNRNWQFLKGFEESYLGLQAIGKVQEVEQAELPHTVQEVPLHYFDESLYQEFSHTGRCSGRMRTGRESGYCL